MSHNSCKIGYIYIYKCVVGNVDNICKIGKTTHFRDKHCRIVQSLRTPYFGFMPYMQFDGTPIVTGFKVRDVDIADAEVQKYFKKQQVSTLEIYVGNYCDFIKKLCYLLKKCKLFIELLEDGVTDYSFLQYDEKISVDTSKSSFEKIKQELLSKYDDLPTEVLKLLRTKADIQDNCPSHLKFGNYVEFPGEMILDLNFDKARRFDILSQLSGFINN